MLHCQSTPLPSELESRGQPHSIKSTKTPCERVQQPAETPEPQQERGKMHSPYSTFEDPLNLPTVPHPLPTRKVNTEDSSAPHGQGSHVNRRVELIPIPTLSLTFEMDVAEPPIARSPPLKFVINVILQLVFLAITSVGIWYAAESLAVSKKGSTTGVQA